MRDNTLWYNKLLTFLNAWAFPSTPKWRSILSGTINNTILITIVNWIFLSKLNLRFWIICPILSFIAAYVIWAIVKTTRTQELNK